MRPESMGQRPCAPCRRPEPSPDASPRRGRAVEGRVEVSSPVGYNLIWWDDDIGTGVGLAYAQTLDSGLIDYVF